MVQDVSSSEKPKETTTQPQEDKRSTEKTDDAPQSDVAKRKSKVESVTVSEKQTEVAVTEVAVVPDTTTAPAKPGTEEKSDRFDATEDRENVNEADNVESENSKNKEGKPNPKDNKMQLKYAYREGNLETDVEEIHGKEGIACSLPGLFMNCDGSDRIIHIFLYECNRQFCGKFIVQNLYIFFLLHFQLFFLLESKCKFSFKIG